MTRGEIYYIKSNKPEEKRTDSLAVIVSNDMLNALGENVEIVYMNQNPWNDMPTHVITRSQRVPHTVQCEKIFTIQQNRLALCAGHLSAEELKAVDMALAISLGLEITPTLDLSDKPIEVERVVEKVVMREPTDEELDKLLEARAEKRLMEAMKESARMPIQILPEDPAIVKAETERDVYRIVYQDMLDALVEIAEGAKG